MPRDKILATIEGLRTEIGHLDSDDTGARERLEQLVVDLEHQLSNPEDEGHSSALSGSMPELIQQYEVEHPRITGILNDLMITLSSMGI